MCVPSYTVPCVYPLTHLCMHAIKVPAATHMHPCALRRAHTHVHTHTCEYTHTHIHTHTLDTHTRAHTHTRTHAHTHTHTHTHTQIHTHAQTHTNTHNHTHAQTRTQTHTHSHIHTRTHPHTNYTQVGQAPSRSSSAASPARLWNAPQPENGRPDAAVYCGRRQGARTSYCTHAQARCE